MELFFKLENPEKNLLIPKSSFILISMDLDLRNPGCVGGNDSLVNLSANLAKTELHVVQQ